MTALSLNRFRELVDAWGADPARWPAQEREAAEALLAQDGRARALQAQAASLDALLSGDRVPPPRPQLRRSILLAARARRTGFLPMLWNELGGLRVAAPTLAASLVLGIAVADVFGWQDTVTPDPSVQAPDYAELALLDGSYEDYVP